MTECNTRVLLKLPSLLFLGGVAAASADGVVEHVGL